MRTECTPFELAIIYNMAAPIDLNTRGVTSIIKVYTDVRLEWGILFRPPSIWMGIIFTSKVYQWGIFFHPKSIWMGKIWKIVYEWGQFSKIVYEWGQFSIWKVYEWVMFFTWSGIWMGWGSGTPAAHPYPKSWQVTPPPPQKNYISHHVYCLSQTEMPLTVRWSKDIQT